MVNNQNASHAEAKSEHRMGMAVFESAAIKLKAKNGNKTWRLWLIFLISLGTLISSLKLMLVAYFPILAEVPLCEPWETDSLWPFMVWLFLRACQQYRIARMSWEDIRMWCSLKQLLWLAMATGKLAMDMTRLWFCNSLQTTIRFISK